MYKCGKCGEKFNKLPDDTIRCPVCAYKVVYKTRPKVAKKVMAR
ncbi:MAG: DNA-directed RNA polymerase subunit P [Candidatus Diapherotrites archaeon]|nr:DNA-directed RNA polymerase subunit P [Candidatus Diapherotrites archaeon]